jgi:glycosyltransferase involved in cell wall biosynthesis
MMAQAGGPSVCYLYQDQYPWDIRVEKIVTTLADNGMDVHIVCRNRTGLPAEEALAERVHVHRLSPGLGRLTRDLINFPAFFSPFWSERLVSVVVKKAVDVIIVRDLPLGPTAYFAGRRTGVPVVMDMAENYPAMIQDTWTYRGPAPVDYVIRNPRLLRKLERWLLPRLNGILVVSEASMRRVCSLTGPEMPIRVVSNTPSVRAEKMGDLPDHPLVGRLRDRSALKLLYVGGMEESRGLDTVVRALALLKGKVADILFVVVGKGSAEAELRSLAKDLGVQDQLHLAGWVDHEHIPNIVAACDICIVPHYVTEHTDTTIPNKIFDYMLQAKPVLATHARSLRNIIEQSACGSVYADHDPFALSQAIFELQDESARRRLGAAGLDAVQNHYNWDQDGQVLVDFVRAIAAPESRVR